MKLQQDYVHIQDFEVSEDNSGYFLEGTKITFFNQGKYPVWIDKVCVIPAANYQVNYEHPHKIRHRFSIRFDTAATPADAATIAYYNLSENNRLVVQTMYPKI